MSCQATEAVQAAAGAELSLSGQALLELLREVLARDKPFRFAAKGHSMIPFIWPGDVICVSPLKERRIALGTVVAFVNPRHGRLTVHRVVGRRSGAYWIQGDALSGATDGLVSRERILGQVTCVERRGRRVRYGLGLERYPIALLSRIGLLLPVYWRLVRLLQPIWRRKSQG